MKTVITALSNHLESTFDLKFGRAAYYCIYDHNSQEVEFVKNQNSDANSGAGTKAAELMANLGITQIISGDFGPKAKTLLDKMKIRMIVPDETNITVNEIIEKFK